MAPTDAMMTVEYVAFEMPDNDTYLGMIRKTVACTVYSGS
jgi:hypothetical protein